MLEDKASETSVTASKELPDGKVTRFCQIQKIFEFGIEYRLH